MKFKALFLLLACMTQGFSLDLENYIETIPDFPKQGISFKWYPKLLKDPEAFHEVIKIFADRYKNLSLNAIVGLDSRGFVFGTALAYEMKLPFVMIRKKGKLPKQTLCFSYDLEYGSSTFEIEKDSLMAGDRVIVVDDILATGGSLNAAFCLLDALKVNVLEFTCLIELSALHGKDVLKAPVFSLLALE